MKSCSVAIIVFMTVASIVLANPSNLYAWQEEDVQSATHKQDETIKGDIVVPIPPVESTEPQYPVQLIGNDGATYIYQTDCCVDGHVGLIMSPTQISPLGCAQSVPVNGAVITLPTSTFGIPHAGQTETEITVCPGANLGNPTAPPFGTPQFFNSVGSFSDYYGNASFMATTVKLNNSRVTRYFNLVKMKTSGKTANGANGNARKFEYEIPVLFLSREEAAREYTSGGQVVIVLPVKEIDIADPVKTDFSGYAIELVTIRLPDPTTAVETDVVCLLINRPAN